MNTLARNVRVLETTMGQITANFGPEPNITGTAHPATRVFSPSPQQQINYQTSCIRWSFTTSLSPFHTAKSNYHTPLLENNTNSLPLFCALIYENKEKKKKEKKEIPSTHRDTSTTGRDKWKRLT